MGADDGESSLLLYKIVPLFDIENTDSKGDVTKSSSPYDFLLCRFGVPRPRYGEVHVLFDFREDDLSGTGVAEGAACSAFRLVFSLNRFISMGLGDGGDEDGIVFGDKGSSKNLGISVSFETTDRD